MLVFVRKLFRYVCVIFSFTGRVLCLLLTNGVEILKETKPLNDCNVVTVAFHITQLFSFCRTKLQTGVYFRTPKNFIILHSLLCIFVLTF